MVFALYLAGLNLAGFLTTTRVVVFPGKQFSRLILPSVGSHDIAGKLGLGKRNSSLTADRRTEKAKRMP